MALSGCYRAAGDLLGSTDRALGSCAPGSTDLEAGIEGKREAAGDADHEAGAKTDAAAAGPGAEEEEGQQHEVNTGASPNPEEELQQQPEVDRAETPGVKAADPITVTRRNCYETSARIRMTFYCFLTMAVTLATSLSVLIYMLFNIMGNRSHDRHLSWQITFLPLFLVSYALVSDFILDLGLDGMMSPSMSQWRSSVTLLGRSCLPRFCSRSAEICYLLGFEGIPAIFAIISIFRGEPLPPGHKAIIIMNNYLLGAICMVYLNSTVFFIARLYLQSTAEGEQKMAVLYHGLTHLGRFARSADGHCHVGSAGCLCSRFRGQSVMRFFAFLLVAATVKICMVVMFAFTDELAVLLVGHLLVTIVVVCYIRSGFPLLVGRAFWWVILGSYLLTFGLLLSAAHTRDPQPLVPLCYGPSAAGYNRSHSELPLVFTPPHNSRGYGYPVCSQHWGHRDEPVDRQLSALDLAALAFASSYPEEEDIAASLHTAFDGTEFGKWNLTHVEPKEVVGRWIVVDFPDQKTRVVAVRGTSNMKDVYADLEVYAGIAVFQIMNLWTPVLNVLGDNSIRTLIDSAMPKFWQNFLDAVREEKQSALANGSSLVLTGHSLGAALAGVGAANVGVQSLGFSAPGLYYQKKHLGVNMESLKQVFSNLQPFSDLVPRVDHQYGAVSWVKCVHNAATCHKLTKTSCELWSQCGDPRGRDWRQTCSEWYTEACTVPNGFYIMPSSRALCGHPTVPCSLAQSQGHALVHVSRD